MRPVALRRGLRPARWARRLSGAIRAAGVAPVAGVDRRRPALHFGQTMTICYARAQKLMPWLDRVAAKGEVFVQFWLGPGEQAVFFDLGNDPPADPIPKELRGFLSVTPQMTGATEGGIRVERLG